MLNNFDWWHFSGLMLLKNILYRPSMKVFITSSCRENLPTFIVNLSWQSVFLLNLFYNFCADTQRYCFNQESSWCFWSTSKSYLLDFEVTRQEINITHLKFWRSASCIWRSRKKILLYWKAYIGAPLINRLKKVIMKDLRIMRIVVTWKITVLKFNLMKFLRGCLTKNYYLVWICLNQTWIINQSFRSK